MASNKAYYWLALAVLALGLNSEYHHGRIQPLHKLVSRSEATLNCLALRAREYVSLAKVFFSDTPGVTDSRELAQAVRREPADFAHIRPDTLRRQVAMQLKSADRAQLVRLGTEMARHQAEFARLQTEQARMIIREVKMREAAVCKDSDLRVTVDGDDETPVVVDVDSN
jgi:hypothetical protein